MYPLNKGHPASTPDERLTFWRTLPESVRPDTIQALAYTGAQGNAELLDTLLDTGYFNLPNKNEHFFLEHNAHIVKPKRLTESSLADFDAIAGVVGRGTTKTNGDDLFPNLVRVVNVSDAFRQFHARFCDALVRDLEGDSLQDLSRAQQTMLHNTVGVALATACAIGANDSVRKLAQACPEACQTSIQKNILFSPNDQDERPKDDPRLTPYGIAFLHSNVEAMQVLFPHIKEEPWLGWFLQKNKDRPITLLNFQDHVSLQCTGDAYVQATQDFCAFCKPSVPPMVEQMLEKSSCQLVFSEKPYLGAAAEGGLFDNRLPEAVHRALTQGQAHMMKALLPRLDVGHWDKVFKGSWTDVVRESGNACRNNAFGNSDGHENAWLLFLNEAESKGRSPEVLGRGDFPLVPLISAGMEKAVTKLLSMGLSPQACENADKIMAVAQNRAERLMPLLASAAAKHETLTLLNGIQKPSPAVP